MQIFVIKRYESNGDCSLVEAYADQVKAYNVMDRLAAADEEHVYTVGVVQVIDKV